MAEGEVHAKQANGWWCEAAWEGLGEGREVRRGARGLLGIWRKVRCMDRYGDTSPSVNRNRGRG